MRNEPIEQICQFIPNKVSKKEYICSHDFHLELDAKGRNLISEKATLSNKSQYESHFKTI